jgi:DNA-binding CsgD family transcriptional regulator
VEPSHPAPKETSPNSGICGTHDWARRRGARGRRSPQASADRLEEAIPLLSEAIELYEGLGSERGVARVGALLREHGIKRGTRRRRVRATSGWESLTGTELKVTGLVAQRLSNPEVAERLFISRHTVESHLKHIYRKLGLSSRLELAKVAVTHAGEVLE